MTCLAHCPLSVEGFAFWAGHNHQVFTALTKPILLLCHCKGFCTVIYLDDILVLVCSKQADKRACLFLCSLLVRLGLHIIFAKSDLHLTQTFCFLELYWDALHVNIFTS